MKTRSAFVQGVVLSLAAVVLPASAQQTITYSDGDIRSTPITITGGTLVASSANAFGSSPITVTAPGSTLTYKNGVTIGNAVTLQADLSFDLSTNATQGGVISESGGSFGITKYGAGTLILSGANTYSGGTTIVGSAILVRNDSALGTGTLVTGFGYPELLSDSTVTLENAIALESVLTIGGSGHLTLSGPIGDHVGGEGSVTIAPIGDVEFSGTNTYSGGTTIDGGLLTISRDANLGAATGKLTILHSGTLEVSGDVESTRPIDLGSSDIYSDTYFTVDEGHTFSTTSTLSCLATGSGSIVSIAKDGAGTFVANGVASTAEDATLNIDEGTFATTGDIAPRVWIAAGAALQFGNGGDLPELPNVTFADDVEDGARIVFDHTGTTLIPDNLLPSNATIVQAGPGTTILPDGGGIFAGLEASAGTLEIDNINTYADTLHVISGAEVVITSAGDFGDADIGGTLTLTSDLGTFFTNLTLESTAVLSLPIFGLTDYGGVAVFDGTLTFGGTLSLDLAGDYEPQVGDAFQLFDYVDLASRSGAFTAITFSAPGYAADFDYATGTLAFTAVPEPGVLALLGIAGSGLAFLRLRSSRSRRLS